MPRVSDNAHCIFVDNLYGLKANAAGGREPMESDYAHYICFG